MESYFLKSKRFWGIAITTATAVLPAIGALMGWDISPALIVDLGVKGSALLTALGGFFGVVLALYGSVKAKGPMVFKTNA